MGFGEVVGHKSLLDRLRRMVSSGRVSHALLFWGPRGIGKKLTAVALFQALNCEEAPGEGCGRCRTCERLARLTHPDLRLISPEGGAIRIEQIRQVKEELSFRPVEAKWRGVIVDDAETMTREAANAFLKTLEEPPPRAVIVLVSCRPQDLPPTVLSRCQPLRFAPLREEEVEEVLLRLGVEPTGLIPLCQGSPGRALELEGLRGLEAEVEGVLKGLDLRRVLEMGERFGRDRDRAKEFLGLLLLRMKEGLQEEADFDAFWRIVEIRRSLDENANVRLAVEAALLCLPPTG